MVSNPYNQFSSTQLILRDQLAVDRTILANERTFLAYIRTALAFALTGAGCIKFFSNQALHLVGGALIITGIGIAVLGIRRTAVMSRNINTIRRNQPSA